MEKNTKKSAQLSEVELSEKKHFDKNAKSYDSNYNYTESFTKLKIQRKTKYFTDLVKKQMGSKGLKILELGAGTGEYTKKVAKIFPKSKIVGLDISPGIISIARKKCETLKNTSFVVRSAYKTKYLDNKFDVVFGFYILHHLDIKKTITEAYRILKPGGLLFFYEPNILNPVVYIIKSNKSIKRIVGDSPDEWAINPLKISGELKGFNQIKIETTEFVFPLPVVPQPLMNALDKIFSNIKYVPFLKLLGGSVRIEAIKR
jgi:ubiquinone/menaquinone biosynthesis C-methylase UbiE